MEVYFMGTIHEKFSTAKTLRHMIIFFLLFLAGDFLSSLLFDLLFSVVKLPIRAFYVIPRMLGCLFLTFFLFWWYTVRILHMNLKDFGITFSVKKWAVPSAVFLPAFVVIIYLFVGKTSVKVYGFWEIVLIVTVSAITALKAGILEEMLFRGYMMKLIEYRWNKAAAILIPSFVFSLLHIPSMETVTVGGILLLTAGGTLVGILFSIAACQGNSIGNSVVLHAVWNFVMVTDLLHITTMQGAYGAPVFSIIIPDNILLTGGGFGVEASLVAITGYLIVCIFICVRSRKSGR